MEIRRPRSSQTVSVCWGEEAPSSAPAGGRLQFEVSECVETMTVTTTTTTKRTFPPVFVREPRPLESLDSREYPLASRPTPPGLANFTFDVPAAAGISGQDQDELDLGRPSLTRQDASGISHLFGRAAAPPPEAGTRQKRRRRRSSVSEKASLAPQPRAGPSRRPSLSRQVTSTLGFRRSIAQTTSRNAAAASAAAASAAAAPAATPAAERLAAARSCGFLATPDAADVASGGRGGPSRARASNSPEAGSDAGSFDDLSGRSFQPAVAFGSGSVATPPVESDPDLDDPFAAAHPDVDDDMSPPPQRSSLGPAHHHRRRHHHHHQQPHQHPSAGLPPLDIAAALDASLPSPTMSPTFDPTHQVADLDDEDDEPCLNDTFSGDSSATCLGDQAQSDGQADGLAGDGLDLVSGSPSSITPESMIESFARMPDQMKKLIMYQFLRRCNRATLRIVADAVNPALQCDFLKQLPLELSLHVLSFLRHADLCRAAQVSSHWRNMIDSNEAGWKELFDRDGFELGPHELEKAILQGWGWQDPEGLLGCEMDLSQVTRGVVPRTDSLNLRSSKRKRSLNGGTERVKRRAGSHNGPAGRTTIAAAAAAAADKALSRLLHPSEGPISAANAAVVAVPDPGPLHNKRCRSLQKMHLFKSLYRRHHMIREGWTSGQVRPSHLAFAAHPRHVITCLQFDEDKIITGSDDALMHIYDTATGQLRKRLDGHDGGVWALQYEGNTLVSGSTDRTVRIWDMELGVCTHIFHGHTSTVRCLQILMPAEIGRHVDGSPVMMPSKPLIITGSRDHSLRVWRLPESGTGAAGGGGGGRRNQPHQRGTEPGYDGAATPNANAIFANASFDLDCPFLVRTLLGHNNSVRAISAHADTLVSGSYDGSVRVWRISTGEELHILSGHSQKVYSVILDHGRNRCISGSMDSFVKIWDLTTGACLYTLEGHTLLVGLLDLRDDRLVSAAADSTLRIWDPETGRCKNTLMAHTGAITCFQHDGRKVISGSEKTVKMWDMVTGECIQDLLTGLGGVWQVKFNHRRCVAAVQRDNITYVEVLDFGAIRDGVPPEELGIRRVLNEDDAQRLRAEAL